MEIKDIWNDKKVIGKEIECSCGCRRMLKCFKDREDGRLELVVSTAFVIKNENKWKSCFLISEEDLKELVKKDKL